ncbi:Neurogenic locus Notch protein [Aphelenchoides besseyi]|nr:Neurogenic locus Notch protein [Aphelenchoides besseyi]
MKFLFKVLLLLWLLYKCVYGGTELRSCNNYTFPCHNRGQCEWDESKKQHRCECSEKFAGQYCEDVDYCSMNPCKNNAKCKVWYGNFFCSCDTFHHGPFCEYKLANNLTKQHGHDGWATLIDLSLTPLSVIEKINFFLNIAKTVNETIHVNFQIYVDSNGNPMIYEWTSKERRQIELLKLPESASLYLKQYNTNEYHKLDNTHSSTFPARREYPNPRLPLYEAVSARNKNWNRRISVYFHFDNSPCLRRASQNKSMVCPSNYDKMWNAVNRLHAGNRWLEPKPLDCYSPITYWLLAVAWLLSLIATAALVWLLVSHVHRRPFVYRVDDFESDSLTEMHELSSNGRFQTKYD